MKTAKLEKIMNKLFISGIVDYKNKNKYFIPYQSDTPNWKKKNSNHYEPLLKDAGVKFKQKGVYETNSWYFYPSKAFAMNKKDTNFRLMIEDVLPQVIEYNKQPIEAFYVIAIIIDNKSNINAKFLCYIESKIADLSNHAEMFKKDNKSIRTISFIKETDTWTY